MLVPTWLHLGSQNPLKSRLGDVLGRLGAVLGRLGPSWDVLGRLEAVLEPPWRCLGAVLGRLEAILGPSWGRLRVVLGSLGAAWGRPGPNFRGKGDSNGGILSWMQFFNRRLFDLPSENRFPNFEKSFKSIGKIIFFGLQAILT